MFGNVFIRRLHGFKFTPGCTSVVDQEVLKNTSKMNMMQSINNALDLSLSKNKETLVFGEDVGFGGVFRCTTSLQEKYGKERVFSTPLCEQGIMGFAIGAAMAGFSAIAEIQFDDYIFPAYDQIVNEAAKLRYRSGNTYNCGKLVVRAPAGAIGHGGHYHSQSVEANFTCVPGLFVVYPRGPIQAKGLLLSSIATENPVIFLEPKLMYRMAVDDVPNDYYEIPLGKAETVFSNVSNSSKDKVTILTYGTMVHFALNAAEMAFKDNNICCEVIDLQTLNPLDEEAIVSSVKKTGKALIVHESHLTNGFGSELAATIQESCFGYLDAPVMRQCGYDIPISLAFEKFIIPTKLKIYDSILKLSKFT